MSRMDCFTPRGCANERGLAGDFADTVALWGQTITRIRKGLRGQPNDVATYRVLVDAEPPRPEYPQGMTQAARGENLGNTDRHNLQYGPDVDILEGDEIVFLASPRHIWEVAKGDISFAPNDITIYQQCQLKRGRPNPLGRDSD